jgi:iron complex transport system substrate-binding protein
LEAVVALGVDPVAAVKPPLTGDYSPVVRDEMDSEPTDIGTSGVGIDIETLLASRWQNCHIAIGEPDLIIMRTTVENSRDVYDQVQSVAPTVVVDYTDAGWKDTLGQVAEFLGEFESAELRRIICSEMSSPPVV